MSPARRFNPAQLFAAAILLCASPVPSISEFCNISNAQQLKLQEKVQVCNFLLLEHWRCYSPKPRGQGGWEFSGTIWWGAQAGEAVGIWKGLTERTWGGRPKDLRRRLEEEITCDMLYAISDSHRTQHRHMFFWRACEGHLCLKMSFFADLPSNTGCWGRQSSGQGASHLMHLTLPP